MKSTDIEEGDILTIKGEKYEVLYLEEDADVEVDEPYTLHIYYGFALHKIGTKTLFPTHELRYYEESGEWMFFTVAPKEKSKTPLTDPGIMNYYGMKRLSEKDIVVKKK